jgi:hypothetical protein
MKRKCLAIGISSTAVVLLVLGSLSNVVGYQTVQSSDQNIVISKSCVDDIVITGTMGENGWYISSVIVTFVGGNQTFFRIDNGSWIVYIVPFVIGTDGIHLLETTSDFVHIYNVTIKIDQTPPMCNLIIKRVGFFKWLLKANVSDATSGINRVEFYIDNSLIGSITAPPYEFIWMGFMFIILLKFIRYGDDYLPLIIPYDNAGNTPMNTP